LVPLLPLLQPPRLLLGLPQQAQLLLQAQAQVQTRRRR
jgi:hypothetical protein